MTSTSTSSQHLRRRLTRFAVQRIDRHAPPRVTRVRRLDHVVLEVGAEAVLRPEERRDFHVRVIAEAIRRVSQAAVDRRRVADDADAAAGDEGVVGLKQAIDPEFHGC